MDPTIASLLRFTAFLTVALTLLLAALKLAHRETLRWRGVRTAYYVSAIGELVTRRSLVSQPPRGWAEDPVFHKVLSDYTALVTGDEARFLRDLTEATGVLDVLLKRSERRLRPSERLEAVATLVDLARPSEIPVLRNLAADRNRHVRVHAVSGLARLRDVEFVPRILDLATAMTPWDAARMADALAGMGSPAVEPICAWISSYRQRHNPPVETISLATRVLGLIGDLDAEQTLIEQLQTNQPDWRLAAASALENASGEAAVQPLLDALEDRSWRVRARAAVALGATAEARVARPVAGLLYDHVWWVRQNAAAALSNLPDGQEYLIAALDGPDRYATDAALNQLTLSGAVGAASRRIAEGEGSEEDHRLLALASA